VSDNIKELTDATFRAHAPSLFEQVVHKNPFLNYIDASPPPTKWQIFWWRLTRPFDRVFDAWDVLLGRAEAHYDED